MPMIMEGGLARLSGQVAIEEAEPLAEWLRATPDAALDLSACEGLHSAVLQVLLAGAPALLAPPPDPWLAGLLPRTPLPNSTAEVP
ncbi:hypothetical protein KTR66_17035 [Roseococcus sp. SDR]|uniref:hypothetical protein n=1 Tax=Roseococcus sp. SDR TaxID=2835532 RepID=UPI001BD15DE8|nr:hypothetical protein [Roseococcus sp. SDR]MBS7791709.1 hypothetical protein [Roseococcus sp. SDR]MBV1847023.1 hypothetical protein [Roseococcus sp. SDR]